MLALERTLLCMFHVSFDTVARCLTIGSRALILLSKIENYYIAEFRGPFYAHGAVQITECHRAFVTFYTCIMY